ncbi:hypothetical protein AGMMS50229_17580 [Campylobacterota bacterium]|nr:hypothetical protein AGMMS50229_17580 [Campylobacterota bacterium]
MKTAQLVVSKNEVELLLRAVIGGGAIAFLLSDNRLGGILLVLMGYYFKRINNKRGGDNANS